jgi:hypothetical protein
MLVVIRSKTFSSIKRIGESSFVPDGAAPKRIELSTNFDMDSLIMRKSF